MHAFEKFESFFFIKSRGVLGGRTILRGMATISYDYVIISSLVLRFEVQFFVLDFKIEIL